VNAAGAISTLFFGLLAGTVRIIAELTYLDGNGKLIEGASGVFASYASINFSHMAIFMFIACVIVCVTVSLATPAQSETKLTGLTFGTLTAEQKSFNKSSYEWIDITASVLLVIAVISVLIYFQG
jgi:SSS family solute:Na+ symporter